MATMNISLPDEMKAFVEERVESGRYANASDYVRDLIRDDQDQRTQAARRLTRIVDEAIASGTVEMSPSELKGYVMERVESAKPARRRGGKLGLERIG